MPHQSQLLIIDNLVDHMTITRIQSELFSFKSFADFWQNDKLDSGMPQRAIETSKHSTGTLFSCVENSKHDSGKVSTDSSANCPLTFMMTVLPECSVCTKALGTSMMATSWPSCASAAQVNITDWREHNGTGFDSIYELNMPFELDGSDNATDYSTNSLSVSSCPPAY